MRPWKFSLKSLVSALVAVAFAIAAEPGVMAMPAPQPMNMDCSATDVSACDHMASQHDTTQQKDQGTPCKNMSVCLGMLNCFGMAAVIPGHPSFLTTAARVSVRYLQQTASGLTLQPDNPPPIA